MKIRFLKTNLLLFVLFGAISIIAAKGSPESLNEKRDKKKDLTIREYNTDANGKSRWLDHVTVYNEEGYKIEEIEYATYGMRERVTFFYDAKFVCIKEVVYDDRNKVSRIRKYDYNPDGTKKTQYNYLPNGRLYSTKVYQYTN
ncbi:MAG: hypothetical protein PHS59_04350 [Paludibacter sp.]|nr:hypothetical protein [Paludibacter sp.]